MSINFIPPIIKDFDVEAALNNVSESKIFHVFGRSINAGALADIWFPGTIRTWLQTASTLVAISTSANDTAAGTGARVITVEGLAPSFLEITEDITMNGLSNSTATTASFIRVNKVFVKDSGTFASTNGGTNIGTISINAGAVLMSEISVDPDRASGVSEQSHFTVPSDKEAILRTLSINVSSNQAAKIYGIFRPRADITSAPFGASQTFFIQDGLKQPDSLIPKAGILFDEKTDIWFSCVSQAATDIDVDYELLVRNKSA